MIIYYFLFAFIISLGWLYKAYDCQITKRVIGFMPFSNIHIKITYLGIVGLLLTLITGLRAESVGIDIRQYKYLYETSDYFISRANQKSEIGYFAFQYFSIIFLELISSFLFFSLAYYVLIQLLNV